MKVPLNVTGTIPFTTAGAVALGDKVVTISRKVSGSTPVGVKSTSMLNPELKFSTELDWIYTVFVVLGGTMQLKVVANILEFYFDTVDVLDRLTEIFILAVADNSPLVPGTPMDPVA